MEKAECTFFGGPVADPDQFTGLAGPYFTEVKKTIERSYKGCCSLHTPPLVAEGWEDVFAPIIKKIIRQVWKDKGMPDELPQDLVDAFFAEFWQAVSDGLGEMADSELAEDQDFIQELQENVYRFSAAKTYSQVKALSEALVDGNGNLRSFKDFKLEAGKINADYVGSWLQTEYNLAIASAQMGAKWKKFERDAEDLPYLRYTTIGDERVRITHQELEGITLRINHPFWLKYFPPNDWGCRCDVIQVSYVKKETDLSKRNLPDLPALFQYNPGITGTIFPDGHPYYAGVPSDKLNRP